MGKNVTKIRITGYPAAWDGSIGTPTSFEAKQKRLATILDKLCLLRSARMVGDTETINNTQLGLLRRQQIPFETVTEPVRDECELCGTPIPEGNGYCEPCKVQI